MTVLPPKIQTYHCICSSLLLASTHTLSNLPTRSNTTGGLDNALILPLPQAPTPNPSDIELNGNLTSTIAPEGYTLLHGISADRKITIVRREDGFEKRLLHRCTRCKLVVGYELQNQGGDAIEGVEIEEGEGKGKGYTYAGKVLYLLPAGIMSTDIMMMQTGLGPRKIGEGDVDLKRGALAVFE
jgi:hypothetical protein